MRTMDTTKQGKRSVQAHTAGFKLILAALPRQFESAVMEKYIEGLADAEVRDEPQECRLVPSDFGMKAEMTKLWVMRKRPISILRS